MSPIRYWLHEYKPIDGGSVLTGNDVSCKTEGFGSIKVKMFDRIVEH